MKLRPAENACVFSVLVRPYRYTFGPEAFDEGEWEVITPTHLALTLPEILRAIRNYSGDAFDPYDMSREQLVELLEAQSAGDEEISNWSREDLLAHLEEEFSNCNILGEIRHEYVSVVTNDDGWREAPAMPWAWPLPDFNLSAEESQARLDLYGSGIRLFSVNGDVVLGLNGGGWDMSWDICYAYLLLGYLPPLEVVQNLKWEERSPLDDKKAYILSGAARTHSVVAYQLQQSERNLDWVCNKAVGHTGDCSMPYRILHDLMVDQGRPEAALLQKLIRAVDG
jgi:hypothetical protein